MPVVLRSSTTHTLFFSASGYANLTTPKAGYVNAGLARIFNSTFVANATSNSSSALSTSTSSTSSHTPNNHASTGAIVGGTLGGMVAIVLTAATVYFILKRRRRPVLDEPKSEGTRLDENRKHVVEKDATTLSPHVSELGTGKWPPMAELSSTPVYAELSGDEQHTAGYAARTA